LDRFSKIVMPVRDHDDRPWGWGRDYNSGTANHKPDSTVIFPCHAKTNCTCTETQPSTTGIITDSVSPAGSRQSYIHRWPAGSELRLAGLWHVTEDRKHVRNVSYDWRSVFLFLRNWNIDLQNVRRLPLKQFCMRHAQTISAAVKENGS